jgi:DNA-directed RNA polymerase specialized sigma24 family protein
MKNYAQSDYALNKNAGGIVYAFADQTVEVTLEDYLLENPGKTAADFAELKALSDADYYETDRSDYRQTWKNMSFDRLTEEELDALCTPSAEQSVIEQGAEEAVYTGMRSSAFQALAKLTEVQRRRYLMYHAHGMTEREIAEKEGAFRNAVHQSLKEAEKKIKKFLSAD